MRDQYKHTHFNMANTYISIKVIMDNLLVHPLLQDLPLDRAIAYAVDFIRIVGMPRIFEDKTEILEIEEYRAMLPNDFHNMLQVRTAFNGRTIQLINSTDNYHTSTNKNGMDYTYKVQGNIIYTSFKEGKIEISYQSIKVDEEGYPMIPDNSSFTRALESYIKKQWFTILFDLNKINNAVLQNVQQDYAFNVGQAQSDLVRPTIDQMESITNMWNSILPGKHHSTGFAFLGSKEQIKTH